MSSVPSLLISVGFGASIPKLTERVDFHKDLDFVCSSSESL